MNIHLSKIFQYILPVIILTAGIFIGLLFQKIALNKLIQLTSKTKIKIDKIFIKSFKGVIFLWFFILSLSIIIQVTKLPEKTVNIINQTSLALFIFSFTLLAANIIGSIAQYYADSLKKSFIPTTIFKTITKSLIVILGILVILQTLGISITPLLTALGVGGLAVALALKETLSNLFAGIQIIFSGQLKPGDFIKLESGDEGYVTDITWRNTTIKKLPENLIIIPNSKLANSMIINYNLPRTYLNVISEVGVSYTSDLEKVEKVTLKTAKNIMKTIPGSIPDFEPVMRYTKFDDFSINFKVIMRVKEYKVKYLIEHEFIKKLHKAYKKEKIEIPFPIRTVYMAKKK